MGGGLMQLVAYGAQDVYLSGTPQITFWKVVYRRHTNFSIETIEQSIDQARPGGKYTVTVTRNGDLAANACLKVKLTAVTSSNIGGSVDQVAWVRRLGHAMVSQVKVEIGGSTIDSHVGTWLDLWYELTHKADQERGYRAMIGDVKALTELRAPASGINAYTVYVPFQFWFCRNTGLALPLIALQYHEVRFHIEMESLQKLIVWNGATAPTFTGYTYQSAAVMVDYVYLDSEERRKFAQVGHEYLIEEVQHNGGETLSGTVSNAGSSLTSKFRLNFNHPCKELVWALKCGAFSGEALTNSFGGGKTFLGYTHDDDNWDKVLERIAKGLVESCISLAATTTNYTNENTTVRDLVVTGTIEGGAHTHPIDVSTVNPSTGLSAGATGAPKNLDGTHFTPLSNLTTVSHIHFVTGPTVTGFDDGDAVTGGVQTHTHTFTSTTGPTGGPGAVVLGGEGFVQRFGSKINVRVTSNNGSVVGGEVQCWTTGTLLSNGTTDLLSLITDADVHVVLTATAGTLARVECTRVSHTLTMELASLPASTWTTDNRKGVGDVAYINNFRSFNVVQPHNYGLNLDGSGNVVATGKLELNGHDRFDWQEGSYFNYVQPRAHTRTPADGVNVYCFGLHPENHQPSGSANLSRIDTTILHLTMTDEKRPSGSTFLDWVSNSKLHIFALNYNVLRVMSGMAGKAYSN